VVVLLVVVLCSPKNLEYGAACWYSSGAAADARAAVALVDLGVEKKLPTLKAPGDNSSIGAEGESGSTEGSMCMVVGEASELDEADKADEDEADDEGGGAGVDGLVDLRTTLLLELRLLLPLPLPLPLLLLLLWCWRSEEEKARLVGENRCMPESPARPWSPPEAKGDAAGEFKP